MYRPLITIHTRGTLGLQRTESEAGSRVSRPKEDMDKTKMAFSVSPMMDAIQAQLDEQPSYRCTICHEVLGLPRQDGVIETAVMLPCGHVFGSGCISRWLEDASTHQDCPNCRRRMVYSECGHHVRPIEFERKPRMVREAEMPGKCGICRGGGELEEVMRRLRMKHEAEERALTGMKIQLPGFFGAFCRGSLLSVDRRIEVSKEDWRREMEGLHEELRREQRVEW